MLRPLRYFAMKTSGFLGWSPLRNLTVRDLVSRYSVHSISPIKIEVSVMTLTA
jgi:hypothetical protein